MTTESFFDVLTRAARHFQTHGYISKDELEDWLRQIDRAMRASLTPQYVLEKMMRDTLGSVYERLVERGGVLRANPGVERWTLERIKPSLRAELDRSILASANLIKLNREEAITKTIRRFSGWATSIPAGGSKATDKAEAKKRFNEMMTEIKGAASADDLTALKASLALPSPHPLTAEQGKALKTARRTVDDAAYAVAKAAIAYLAIDPCTPSDFSQKGN